MNKKLHITAEMVAAAEAVFVAMAIERSIRPVVEGYQAKILKELGYSGYPLKDTGLLPEEVFEHYDARCKEELDKAKLVVKRPESCPLLEAKNNVMKAQHALIEVMEPVTGLTPGHFLCSPDGQGLEHLAEYIDINLRMLARFVRNADDLMKEVENGKPRSNKRKKAGLQAGN